MEWIDVNDRLPEPFVSVLALVEGLPDVASVTYRGKQDCWKFDDGELMGCSINSKCIKYWMPYPPVPDWF